MTTARGSAFPVLSPREGGAVKWFVRRVLDEVPARLLEAALFGSKARGDDRPNSDLDVLLVFQDLPPDRAPHASEAERIADEVAVRTDVPLTVWSVALHDLEHGARTPMLVDALSDGLPIWCASRPVPRVGFTPADALSCTRALLRRVDEGSDQFVRELNAGNAGAAAKRARDDLVRLCTALQLLRGATRPRRAEVIDCARRLCARDGTASPPGLFSALKWARDSFGPDGRHEEDPVLAPPGSAATVGAIIDHLRDRVERESHQLQRSLEHGTCPYRSV